MRRVVGVVIVGLVTGWLVLGAPRLWVSKDRLTSKHGRMAAIDDLGPWQAGLLVPQLEKWAAMSGPESQAAFRALVRADNDDSVAVLRRHATSANPDPVLNALSRRPTPRACEVLAEAFVTASEVPRPDVGSSAHPDWLRADRRRQRIEQVFRDPEPPARACVRALVPLRDRSPAVDQLYREVAASRGPGGVL